MKATAIAVAATATLAFASPTDPFAPWVSDDEIEVGGIELTTEVSCSTPAAPFAPDTALEITVSLPNWNATTMPNATSVLNGGIELTYTVVPSSPVTRGPRPHVCLSGSPYNITNMTNTNKTVGAMTCQAYCDADVQCQGWTYVEGVLMGYEHCALQAAVGCPWEGVDCWSGSKAPAANCTVPLPATFDNSFAAKMVQGPLELYAVNATTASIRTTLPNLRPSTLYTITARANNDVDYMQFVGWGADSAAAICSTAATEPATGKQDHPDVPARVTETVSQTDPAPTRFVKFYRMTECSPRTRPDYLENKDCADAEGTVASYTYTTVVNYPTSVINEYCVEMLDVPYGHYLSCTPGARWANTTVGCGIGPGYMDPPRGTCSYPCWCSVQPDLMIGGDPLQHTCDAGGCCNCSLTDPTAASYSATHVGRMNYTGEVESGTVQGGWYSFPQAGRCTNGQVPGDASGCTWRLAPGVRFATGNLLHHNGFNTSSPASWHYHDPTEVAHNVAVLQGTMDWAGGSTPNPCDATAFAVP